MSELDLLRSLPYEIEAPAEESRNRARGRLLRHLRHSRDRRRRRLLLPAVGLAALGAVGVLVNVGNHGGGASAAPVLRGFAAIARDQAPPTVVKRGQFRYTKSIQAYMSGGSTRDGRAWNALGPRVREAWLGPTGGMLHEVSAKPRFLSAADRRAWIAAGRPEVNPPVATEKLPPTEPLDLPTDPDALYRVIHDRAVGHGSGTDSEMFTLVADSLRETDASPALRAALYEVAARIPGVELIGPATDRTGRHGVAVAFSDSKDHERHELIFDRRTAALLEEEYVELKGSFYGYPPGTITGYSTYVTSAVVDRLGARPKRSN